MASLLQRFSQSLVRYPFITNMLVTGSLYASGDVSQQLLRGNKKPDLKNAARIGAVGGLILAPLFVPWYKMLDRFLPGVALRTVLTKCVMDQVLFAPITLSLFFIATSVLERRNDIFASLRERGLKTYLTACIFWPPVQTVNFLFIPGHYRTVYIAGVSFVWTNILCYLKSKPTKIRDLEAAE